MNNINNNKTMTEQYQNINEDLTILSFVIGVLCVIISIIGGSWWLITSSLLYVMILSIHVCIELLKNKNK